jgi:aminomethyltransferase
MKKTALYDKHASLGAKIVPFAGYEMPVSYAGIIDEHNSVRNAVGVFDVSHMGEFIVKGTQALDLIQKVTSNDASKLEIGEVQYSCLPNDKGGIVDDLLVYRLPEDNCSAGERAYMLVVNASNIEKDWNWINSHNNFEAKLTDISEKTSLLAIQGPKAAAALQSLTEIDLQGMKYYTFAKGKFAGIDNVLVSATGYTGAGGFEVYVDDKDAEKLWDAVFAAGEAYGIQPIGLGARDTLRLEMGFCLYGNDIDDTTSPIEAGLGWITKLKKGDFVGREFCVNHKENGSDRKLVGFIVNDKRPARHGYAVLDADGNHIGIVTSGSTSPSLGYPVGLAYVKTSFSTLDTTIYIDVRGKAIEAKVSGLPFVSKG